MDAPSERDVGRLTAELTSSDSDARREAAGQLRETGFAQRVSLEKRGTLGAAADTSLADHELNALHEAAKDDDRHVQLKAIEALGDFGDQSSVPVLLTLATDTSETDDVRLAAIDSAGDIGGPEALTALARIAGDASEPEDMRLAALSELEELAAKRITSGPDRHFDPPQGSPPAPDEDYEPDDSDTPEAQQAKAELRRICVAIAAEEGARGLLRLKASDIRAYLDSGVTSSTRAGSGCARRVGTAFARRARSGPGLRRRRLHPGRVPAGGAGVSRLDAWPRRASDHARSDHARRRRWRTADPSTRAASRAPRGSASAPSAS